MNDLTHLERLTALRAAHGPATTYRHTAAALRMIGEPGIGIDPADAVAYLYRDRAAFEAYSASNRDHNAGVVEVLGGAPLNGDTSGAWIGAVRFRQPAEPLRG